MYASLHSARIALARGCSLLASKLPARDNSSFFVMPSAGITSVTFGTPSVMVPVLSSATMSTCPVSWRLSAVLKRIPFLAPTPLPTIIATGVASPRAQGQLTTNTVMALARENPMGAPTNSQIIRVNSAMIITTGTNTPEIRSASLATGALVAAASLTI